MSKVQVSCILCVGIAIAWLAVRGCSGSIQSVTILPTQSASSLEISGWAPAIMHSPYSLESQPVVTIRIKNISRRTVAIINHPFTLYVDSVDSSGAEYAKFTDRLERDPNALMPSDIVFLQPDAVLEVSRQIRPGPQVPRGKYGLIAVVHQLLNKRQAVADVLSQAHVQMFPETEVRTGIGWVELR